MGMSMSIRLLTSNEAEESCRRITETLPEWFGIPEANQRYAKGVRDCLCLGWIKGGSCLGILALERLYPNNFNLFWMGVERAHQGCGIGSQLLEHAVALTTQEGAHSLTVETLSPHHQDPHYLRTLHFYRTHGFEPLFELQPYGPELHMLYLIRICCPQH